MNTGIGQGRPLSGLSSLARTRQAVATFQEQASSGRRVTSAAVDPAAMGVFVEIEATAASERVAVRDANDGLSLVQTADAAAGSVTDALQRMRELGVQASSDTLADDQRALLDDEYQQLREELDRTASAARFGDRPLADGSAPSIDVQVGAAAGEESRIDVGLADLRGDALGVTGTDLSSAAGAREALGAIDGALDAAASQRADLGSTFRSLESALEVGAARRDALVEAGGRVMDADFAELVSKQAGAVVQERAGLASIAQAQQIHRVSVMGLLS